MSMWPETQIAKSENRHEIKLSGPEISKRISDNGLDRNVFMLKNLNLLNISDTCLKDIPDSICELSNLQTLLLYGNLIDVFNENICTLTKLKVLDLSRNNLQSIPLIVNNCKQLASINLSSNSLEHFPSVNSLVNLISLDLSNNKLVHFPDICSQNLVHLSDLKMKANSIESIPGNIAILPVLKNFDIADNQLKIIPAELAQLSKLKELNLKGNTLLDKRLLKLVEQSKTTKQILDYVRQNCPKASDEIVTNGSKPVPKKVGKKVQSKKNDDQEESADPVANLCHSMSIIHLKDDIPNIKITDHVKIVRQHIVCCIINNLKFTEESFKKFIQMQTKLHDTICDKRNVATIATHDFNKLPAGDLLYTAKPPQDVRIQPLLRQKIYTGLQLFQQLQAEAENLRKEKKRNVYSGIHKFLYLLEGKALYPCLEDAKGNVISFPPITNSDLTKMSHDTTKMLVEVTSASSQTTCRKIMDALLKEILLLGVSGPSPSAPTAETAILGSKYNHLEIQQVKVVDLAGNLKVVYPSRADLLFEGEEDSIKVSRE